MEEEAKHRGLQLPRQLGDRVLLAAVALPIAAITGPGLYAVLVKSPKFGVNNLLQHLVITELLGATFILSAGALVWAAAQPAWLERL